MKNQQIKYVYLPAIISLFILASCREGIISPDNPAGNLNEPVTTNSFTSYSFLINAEKISYNVVDYPNLNSVKTSIFSSLSDHKSGSVEIVILDVERKVLYANLLNENSPGVSNIIQGRIPYVVELSFQDFSGRLKVLLTRND